jgi:hypothetical protein
MTDKTIHNIRLSYDESDERVRNFVEYLKSEARKDVVKNYYESTMSRPEKLQYINDEFGNEFILTCTNGHNCALKLRGT